MTISIPVDITPPVADDSLVEPEERRVRHEPTPARSYRVVAIRPLLLGMAA